jgi:transcriptional regulator with XRE-family HTH domain
MVLFRRLLGDVLRRHRQRQQRTLRDVAAAAKVSLGYLSEIERGRKEASSELLGALCAALGISLADVLREVSDDIAALERGALAPIGFTAVPSVARPVATMPAVVGASYGRSVGEARPLTARRPAVAATDVMSTPVGALPSWRMPVAAA